MLFEDASRSCSERLTSMLFWDRYFEAGGSGAGEAERCKETTGGLEASVTD